MTRAQLSHGLSYTPEYRAWQTARHRCTSPTSPAWSDYGGRGIRMCEEWLKSPAAFIASVGLRPSPKHEIDRRDNDGNYEPGNCHWVVRPINCRNRRSSVHLEYGDETMTITEWAARLGIGASTIAFRLRHGWSADAALSTPARPIAEKGCGGPIKHPCMDCQTRLTLGLRCRGCENHNRIRTPEGRFWRAEA